MRLILLLVMAGAAGVAQAATPQFPQKRVLTPEGVRIVGQAPVVVAEINRGIEKSWFDKSKRSGGYAPMPASGDPLAELAGIIVAAGIIEAFKDRGPYRNAQTAAGEIAERLPTSTIQASLLKHIEDAKAEEPVTDGVSLGTVSTVQKVMQPRPIEDALEIESSYSLSEDGSAFRALIVARYQSSKLAYVTPHDFNGKPPKSERKGPIYRNVFLYRSNRLPVPPNDSNFKVLLIAAIEDNYRDAAGALPASDSKEAKAMAEAVEEANHSWYTKDEIANIMTHQWLAEDGKRLKQEVENAHTFFARYLLKDLNSMAVPEMHGDTEILETIPGERIVRRLNSGVSSGTYESIPDATGDLTQYASYGNATAISKAQERRIQILKQH